MIGMGEYYSIMAVLWLILCKQSDGYLAVFAVWIAMIHIAMSIIT